MFIQYTVVTGAFLSDPIALSSSVTSSGFNRNWFNTVLGNRLYRPRSRSTSWWCALVVVVAFVVTLSAREMARPTLLRETVVAAFCVFVVSVLVMLLPGTFMEVTFYLLPLFLWDPFSENNVIRPEMRVSTLSLWSTCMLTLAVAPLRS